MDLESCNYYFKQINEKVFKVVKAPIETDVVRAGDRCGPIFMKYIFENRELVVCESNGKVVSNY